MGKTEFHDGVSQPTLTDTSQCACLPAPSRGGASEQLCEHSLLQQVAGAALARAADEREVQQRRQFTLAWITKATLLNVFLGFVSYYLMGLECVCTLHTYSPRRSEEGTGSPAAGVKVGWELPVGAGVELCFSTREEVTLNC